LNTCTSASVFFSMSDVDSGGGLVFSGAVPWSLVIVVCMWKPGTLASPSPSQPRMGLVSYSIWIVSPLYVTGSGPRECILLLRPTPSLRIRPRSLTILRDPGSVHFVSHVPRVRFWSALRGAGSCVFEKYDSGSCAVHEIWLRVRF